jgi:hypothetical protein
VSWRPQCRSSVRSYREAPIAWVASASMSSWSTSVIASRKTSSEPPARVGSSSSDRADCERAFGIDLLVVNLARYTLRITPVAPDRRAQPASGALLKAHYPGDTPVSRAIPDPSQVLNDQRLLRRASADSLRGQRWYLRRLRAGPPQRRGGRLAATTACPWRLSRSDAAWKVTCRFASCSASSTRRAPAWITSPPLPVVTRPSRSRCSIR